MSSRLAVAALGAVALLTALASCAAPSAGEPSPAAPAAAPAQAPAPGPGALHNVHRVDERLISGAAPAGDAAFDELARLGVRTILSVDGGRPDVARASARGMRYVHIPITYATITAEQRLELSRAVRDLPGPVYVHCHHGKHRGPAATAAIAVTLGRLDPAAALELMRRAGTAASYEGLYACVAELGPATPAELDRAPAGFPAVREVEGIVAAMVEVDEAFEHLGAIREAGWTVPPAPPDLVPAAEAGRLTEGLRAAAEDPLASEHGDDFLWRLSAATRAATALEEALARGQAGGDELEALFRPVQTSCRECHSRHRDRR